MDMEPAAHSMPRVPAEPLNRRIARRYELLVNALVLSGLLGCALLYGVHAHRVISYPSDVDNIEGFVLYQGHRLAQGESGYPPLGESPPYLVDTYPPLYPLTLALGVELGFPGLGWARLVSTIAVAGVMMVVFAFVYGRTERFIPSLVAALLIPATYHIYHWGSLARVDSLGLFLTAVALLLVDREKFPWLAAVLFALATFTKPSFLAGPVAALACGILREKRREASLWFLVFVLIAGGLHGTMHVLTAGRSTTQVFLHNVNVFRPFDVLINFRWWFLHTPVLSALGLAYVLECRRTGRHDLASIYLLLSGLAALSVGKIGSGPNYFFELILACCFCAGLVLAAAVEAVQKHETVPVYQSPLFIKCMLLVQLLATVHWPGGRGMFGWAWSPTEREVLEARKLEKIYESAEGPVLTERPGLALQAGHKPWWQPFICTQLDHEGQWDQQPVIDALRDSRFEYVGMVMQGDRDQMDDVVREALESAYSPVTGLAGTILYAPNTPTATPTATPTFTPTPTATPTSTRTPTPTPTM